MTEIEVLNEKFEDFRDVEIELCNMCIDFIIEKLHSLPSNKIYLNSEVIIMYIGFYDINPYSKIKCVYLKNGDIYADTEDEDDYKITNANANELYEIAKAISSITEK